MEHQAAHSIGEIEPFAAGDLDMPMDYSQFFQGDDSGYALMYPAGATNVGTPQLGFGSLRDTADVPLLAPYPPGDIGGSTSAGTGAFGPPSPRFNSNQFDDNAGLPKYHGGTSTTAGLGIAQGGFSTLLDNTSIPVPAPYPGGDIADNGFRPQLDNGDLPSTVAGGIGGSLSLVAGTGIAYQHGFRPQVDNANLPLPVAEGIGYQHRLQGSACLPLPIENPAGADPSDMSTPSQREVGPLDVAGTGKGSLALANAQPEFAAGPTQQHSYPAHYVANGQVEEFNSLDAIRDSFKLFIIRYPWYFRDHVVQAGPGDIRDERRLFIQSNRQELSSLFWKEKHDDAIAIRGGPGQSQRYVATKRTYEFHGTKPDKKKKLFMNEYRLLDPHKDRPDDLVIDEELVFRVVFSKEGDSKRVMNHTGDRVQSGKRVRPSNEPSDAWPHFTKIFNKDDERMYAVCHDCDRILSAPTRNGTSNLNRHHETHLQPSSS